ncbi:unnamed protein product [Kuraishia capsulata CBS 1993]|uniref:Transcription factor Iwr1 domain-containing protein n=1 Tax=Kuraishia capsulata CBS 1993 TaxID=1382522 RepID=W6MJE7_9ASCO|nr:uncharacterized protein KUCA_T00002059001 [Kuraishia capsulata CBS 1993]CDK26088.1 unnamed protein product [Kuraishia capsulata CBS 1993]
MFRQPPNVLRVKRKRTEDPLQALVLESNRLKRSRSDQYIFKLLRTDENANEEDPVLKPTDEKNYFEIPKPEVQLEDEQVSKVANRPEVSDLLQDYLKNNDVPTKAPRRRRSSSAQRAGLHIEKSFQSEAGNSEYVYDVYFRDKAVAERLEKDKIGYIKFDDEYDLLGEFEQNSDNAISDDEDSNAEDFYKNDYPDDDDYVQSDESYLNEETRTKNEFDEVDQGFGGMSDDEDDQYDISHDHRRFSHGDYLENEGLNDEELESYYTKEAPKTSALESEALERHNFFTVENSSKNFGSSTRKLR